MGTGRQPLLGTYENLVTEEIVAPIVCLAIRALLLRVHASSNLVAPAIHLKKWPAAASPCLPPTRLGGRLRTEVVPFRVTDLKGLSVP